MAKAKNTYFLCPGPLKVFFTKEAKAADRTLAAEIRIALESEKARREEARKVLEP